MPCLRSVPIVPRFRRWACRVVGAVCLLTFAWRASAATPDRADVPAASGAQNVAAVRLKGLETYTPEQILPRMQTQTGHPYNAADVSTDLRELGRIMRTAKADTQTTTGDQVEVIFTVTEFPKYRGLQVVGNHKVTTARIESLAKLSAGAVLNEVTQNGITKAVRTEYRSVGMPQAKVTLNLIDVPGKPGEADVQLMIDEGEQIKVGDLIVRGNEAFSGLRLRQHLETKGSWWFLKNYYDEATFEDDLARLREFYALHGHFDAKVERGMFEIQTVGGQKRVSPVVQITEGPHYRFGTAEVRGVRLFSQGEALAPFKPLEGKPFDGEKFSAALQQLEDLYHEHGLLTTEIAPDYKYDAENKVLNMVLDVHEQQRIYVGKVKISRPPVGEDSEKKSWFRSFYDQVAPPVKDEVIVREVLLEPGQIYNKRLEEDSLRRLSRLGVFENDSLKVYNEPTGEAGLHNVVVEANEAVTGSFGGGVGYSDVAGIFGFVQVSEKNVGGNADVFSTRLQLGQKASSASIGYLNRHLGDSDDSLNTDLHYADTARPGYRVSGGGVSSELSRPLENNWIGYLRGRIEANRLSPLNGFEDADENLNESYAVVAARLRFEQDTRLPIGRQTREGYLQVYGVEAGYAGGPLVRLEGARDQYFTLTEKLTYRLAASAGLMPYSASTMPIEERYFLGGNNDMRGFAFRGAGYFDPEEDRLPTGGAAKLLARNELLFPIYNPVSGVLFTDVGTLGESPVQWQAPRVSSGAGLRFDLKNVQVGLDLAMPVIKQSNDQTRFFHFTLQSQF